MCAVLLPPGDNQIAVNKYIISMYGLVSLSESISHREIALFEVTDSSIILGNLLKYSSKH
jgi:hypothetical protein